jgi:hypothetical protein
VEIIPPRVPELEEVKGRVQQVASSQEQRKALEKQVDLLTEELRTAVASGSSFAEAASEKGLNVLTSDPITMMTLDPRRNRIPMEMIRELPAHQAGEVIGPVQTQFGGFFIGSVKERNAQPVAKEEALPQVRQMLASQLQFQGMFNRFQENVIQPMIEKL